MTEIEAWEFCKTQFQNAKKNISGVYCVSSGESGICPIIVKLPLNDKIRNKMLRKIDKLPYFYLTYRWNHCTEEGRQQRVDFCEKQIDSIKNSFWYCLKSLWS